MAEVKALPKRVDWHNSSGQVGVLPLAFIFGIQIAGLLFMCVEYIQFDLHIMYVFVK